MIKWILKLVGGFLPSIVSGLTPFLNPWFLLGLGVVLAGVSFTAGKVGYSYAEARCRSAEADRRELADEIRTTNLDFANQVAGRVEKAIGKIRINHTTVVQPEIRHEREIHKVLQDPNCAVPVSTVRVLNHARGFITDSRSSTPEPDNSVQPADQTGGDSAPAPG